MRKKLITLIALSLVAVGAATTAGVLTYAYYEKVVKIEDASSVVPPLSVDKARNTDIYLVPSAWSNSNLLYGGSSVDNCYVAMCMWKSDNDDQYQWQFLRTSGTANTHERYTGNEVTTASIRAAIKEKETAVSDTEPIYKFTLDLTYYDRFSFLRIGYTSNLEAYMGSALNSYTCKNDDANPVPVDWRNRDDSDDWRRYDSTHRLSKQVDSNVFRISSTNSSGPYGMLAWGNWASGLEI